MLDAAYALLLEDATESDTHRKSEQEPSRRKELQSMIYSRVPQSAKDEWKDELGIDDEDMEGVLAWMQKKGGIG